MSVRAKFVVESVEGGSEGGTVHLRAVSGGSPENDQFYRWTPGGDITLSTINGAALAQFEKGREFYVDFTPADQKPQELPPSPVAEPA